MMKVLLIGSGGYIGRHLLYYSNKLGFETRHAGHKSEHPHERNYTAVDITNPLDIEKLDFNVDIIIVTAGLTGTSQSFDRSQDFLMANESGLLNILNHRRRVRGNAKIVFLSTRLVYEGAKNHFLKETDPLNPKTVYAVNKVACENYLKCYQGFFDIPYTVYRICVPYGNIFDNNYSYGTIGFFLSTALKNENITLYGKGEPKRSFTHIEDLCKLIIKSMPLESTKNGIFNIGGNDNTDLKTIASMVAKKFGVDLEYVEWPSAAATIESGDTMFDDSKIMELLDFNYKYKLEDWINNLP